MIFTKTQRIVFEIAFFLLLFYLVNEKGNTETGMLYILSTFNFIILYIHALINRFFIFKFLFPQKKYFKFLILSLINISIHAVLLNKLMHYTENFTESKEILKYLSSYTFFYGVGDLILGFIIMSGIEFLLQFLKVLDDRTKKEKLIHALEAQNLKSQLNPHFLFNSLNNAYGLSLSNPALASEYIMSLSQLMRYQIESVRKEEVPLTEEIQFLENFLEVEQIRIGQRCSIVLDCDIEEEEMKYLTIAPLIFLAFVENAVKHGTNTIDDSCITIKVSIKAFELHFTCLNSVPLRKLPTQNTETGLANVKNRLALVYPSHILQITESEQRFLIDLTLQLDQRNEN
jgi:two-component system, LytTR family, sensor kinase